MLCILLNESLAHYILLVKFVLFSMFIYHVLCIYVINTGLNADLSSGVHGLVTVLILYICGNYLFDLMMLYAMVRYSVKINAFQIRFQLYVPPNWFLYTFVMVEMSMNTLYWPTYVTFLWFFLVIYSRFIQLRCLNKHIIWNCEIQ